MTSDTSRDSIRLAILVSIAVFAHAAYWFVGGHHRGASSARNSAVVAQAVAGASAAAWFWYRSRRVHA